MTKTPTKAKAKTKTAAKPKATAKSVQGPAAGERAPTFILPTGDGGRFDLKAQKGKAIVLYFYPKDDTSGCTKEAIDFTTHLKAFEKAGAIVVGCSRDSAESHAKFAKKHNLGVTLVADTEGKVTEAYGVWVEKSMYGRKYMGIERATFLIDRDGKIAHVWRPVKVPGHAQAVLAALGEL